LNCGKQFSTKKQLSAEEIWRLYTQGKQTYSQLSKMQNCSVKTIQRYIDKYQIKYQYRQPRNVVVLMDTTYFGRSFGVMLFKDALSGENLLKFYVKYETNALYKQGIESLIYHGFNVQAIVCDGRRGLFNLFDNIPIQMCQFHQVAIAQRYITRNPRMPASIEFKGVMMLLSRTDKESFIGALDLWYLKWEKFLNERTHNPITGKSHYTHKRLRSAYKSVKRNLPWLFTWYDYPQLNIPNTTNALDGYFSNLKNKLRNHNGLSLSRKKKFIDGFLKV
jgi:hypothetical protein